MAQNQIPNNQMQSVNVASIAAKYKCKSLPLFLLTFYPLAKYEIHFFLSVVSSCLCCSPPTL